MFPNPSAAVEHSTEDLTGVNLSLCPVLQILHLYLEPKSATDKQSLDMLEAMLNSWTIEEPFQELRLYAYYVNRFTRQGFANLLKTIGQIVEEWAHGSQEIGRAHV